MSVATSTPVAPLGARNGAANLAERTLGALAGRNDAVSLRTTLASEGSSTTEATVADTQNATTGQRHRTTVRSIVESTRGTLRFASRGEGAGEAGLWAARKDLDIRKKIAGVDPATTTVYMTNSGDNTVAVIDSTTNTVTATAPVGSGPHGVGSTRLPPLSTSPISSTIPCR